MGKQVGDIYPNEGESWTSISGEVLEEKGFEAQGGVYIHPKLNILGILYNEYSESWRVSIAEPFVNESKQDSIRWKRLRDVKYMYQIDNMFHGFTDRWLGYI